MIWSQYYAIRCNACEGHYYVDNGDPSDMTMPDAEAVKCPWCSAVEMLGDDFEFDDVDDKEGDDELYADVGEKSLPERPPPEHVAQ